MTRRNPDELWKVMKTVLPGEYVDASRGAAVVKVVVYDLRPDAQASMQLVASVRVDGKPLGIVFTREKRMKVWANWSTVMEHFKEVIVGPYLDISVKFSEIPEECVRDFDIPAKYRDSLVAVGPIELQGPNGKQIASDSRNA